MRISFYRRQSPKTQTLRRKSLGVGRPPLIFKSSSVGKETFFFIQLLFLFYSAKIPFIYPASFPIYLDLIYVSHFFHSLKIKGLSNVFDKSFYHLFDLPYKILLAE